MDFHRIVNSHHYLYMTHITEPEDNALKLIIEEAKPSGFRRQIDLGIVTVEDTQEMVSDDACYAYEFVFANYVSYAVRNQAYAQEDPSEEYSGRLYRIYTKSRFLDFVTSTTIADKMYPDLFKHYGFNCLNHVVNVVTVEDPSIVIVNDPNQQ